MASDNWLGVLLSLIIEKRMKGLKKSINILSLYIVLFCCISCMNGGDSPWVGKWQLREYQYPDGTTTKVDSVFYGFQKGSFLTYYMGTDGGYRSMYGYYEEENDEITIHLWQPEVDDYTYQKWFGWENDARTFKVEELNSDRIRLNYHDTIYVFRSY